MTPDIARKIAPAIKAILQVSPIQPVSPVPSSKSKTEREGSVPLSIREVKIVAPVVGVEVENIGAIDGVAQLLAITDVKDIKAKTLPAIAGLTKFLPVPPKIILTTIIANTLAKSGA